MVQPLLPAPTTEGYLQGTSERESRDGTDNVLHAHEFNCTPSHTRVTRLQSYHYPWLPIRSSGQHDLLHLHTLQIYLISSLNYFLNEQWTCY